jgi:uncharacterized protein YpmS
MAKRIIRVISWTLLALTLVSVLLALRKPSFPMVEVSAQAARSFDEKMTSLAQTQEQRVPGEIRLTEAEINSKIQESLKNNPPPAGAVTLKGAVVHLEGAHLRSMLTINAKGVDLHVTVAGSLNFSSHTVRLIPSEVSVGSLPLPASWLDGKIDIHMEVPEAVTEMRVENGELVVQAQ